MPLITRITRIGVSSQVGRRTQVKEPLRAASAAPRDARRVGARVREYEQFSPAFRSYSRTRATPNDRRGFPSPAPAAPPPAGGGGPLAPSPCPGKGFFS